MNKIELIKYIELNYSIAKLAEHFGKGRSTIRYWLKKYGLKTNKNIYDKNYKINEMTYKICNTCNILKQVTCFFFRKDQNKYRNICRKCQNEKIRKKYKNYRKDFVNYKGYSCEICGIKSDIVAIYDFHHKDPSEKEFALAKYRGTKINDKIKKEIDKCHLLCSNCHREVHGGLHPNYLIKQKTKEIPDYTIKYNKNELKKCKKCDIFKPYSMYFKYHNRNTYYSDCKECSNNKCVERLRIIKKKCIDYKGGKCQHCGYNKYFGSLDFHHIDPTKKDFTISRNFGPFETHKKELDKCLCLCSNCHRIEHHKLRQKGIKIII